MPSRKSPLSALSATVGSFALLALIACTPPKTTDNRAAIEQTIRGLDAQWSKTAGAHDVDGTVSFYSDDARLLAMDEPAATDKKAIRASWAAFLATVETISWEVKTADVAKSEDLAYVTGAWTMTPKGEHEPKNAAHGKFLEVWKKQSDGNWKCVADTYNSDASLTAAVVEKK